MRGAVVVKALKEQTRATFSRRTAAWFALSPNTITDVLIFDFFDFLITISANCMAPKI